MSDQELLPYNVLKPISYKGDRVEKGTVIRMTPEEAENIGDEFLEPAEEADNAEIPVESSKPEESDEDENKSDDENDSDKDSSDTENADADKADNENDSADENTHDTDTDENV